MQEQMQRLQQQLEASQKISNASAVLAQTPEISTGPKPVILKQSRAKPSQKMETQAGKHRGLLLPAFYLLLALCLKKSLFFSVTSSQSSMRETVKESSVFVDELNTANSFKLKARVAHKPKPSTSGNFLFFSLHWPA